MRWYFSALALVGGLAFAPVALAQSGADDATRAAARTLGAEGLAAYDAGDYAVAAEKLGRAYAVVPVPTLGLWLARSLARTGRLVEASERYGEVTRLVVTGSSNVAAQKDAQAQAKQERAELQPRIPTIRIGVQGADPAEVQITADGSPVPSELLDVPRPVNPGERIVEGKRGVESVTKTVVLTEGQQTRVVLTFEEHEEAESPSSGAQEADGSSASRKASTPIVEDRSGLPPLAWVGFVAGGAGVLAGSITGGLSLSATAQARKDCVGNLCAEPARNDIDRAKSFGTVSTVSFGVGVVGLGVGLTAALISGGRSRGKGASHQTSTTAMFGPNYVGLAGVF